MKFKDLILLIFLIAAFTLGSLLSRRLTFHSHSAPPVSNDHIVWETSFKESLEKAKTSRRLVFVDFYAPWCGYCRQMEKTTYQNAKLIRLSHEFVCARVDVDKRKDLAEDFHVDGLPTLIFLDPRSSKVVKRLEGYTPPPNLIADMLSLLKGAGDSPRQDHRE